jgi:hypothetical protein
MAIMTHHLLRKGEWVRHPQAQGENDQSDHREPRPSHLPYLSAMRPRMVQNWSNY